VITNKLIETDGKYQIDFDDLEEKAAEPANKILILCSPHNPVGKIWSRDELGKILSICIEHHVLLLSDEIHADIIYKGHKFISSISVSESVDDPVMIFGSPGKTFGIPGISDAFIYTNNLALKEKIKARIMRFHLGKSNAFTNAATQAAYAHGSEWLDEMIVYLQSNVDFIYEYLKSELPEVVFNRPEGTYQVWLDFRNTGLDTKTIGQILATKALVGLNIGHMYGREGAGFARMNIATQRSTVEKGMERIKTAFNN
jgi:cystathionine beta-lyase